MSGSWSNGLFECFGDISACLKVCFCPCCAAGEIYEEGGMGSCMVGCILYCFLGICYPCVITGPLREKKGIEGSCVTDTCLCCFCGCCQMTRELREVRGT